MIRLYAQALAGYRRRAVIAIATFALAGLAESAAIIALLPFLEGSIAGGAETRAWFGLEGRPLALAALGTLIGLGGVAALLRYLADASVFRLWVTVELTLRERITRSLLGMRWTSYARLPLGDNTKAVVTEATEVGRGAYSLVSGLGNLMVAVGFIIAALAVSVTMTAVILVFAGASVLVYRAAGRRAEARGQSLSSQAALVTEIATDLFGNAKFHRSTGDQATALRRASSAYRQWRDDFYRLQHYQPASRLIFDLTGIAFVSGVLALSILLSGATPAGALVLVALFYRLAPRVQLAQQGILMARAHMQWWVAWSDRFEAALQDTDERGGTRVVEGNPHIVCEAASFVFPDQHTPVLSTVSWELRPGECLAIVGDSGSGKTTMIDLVTGLLQPTAGRITLDGRDLEEIDIEGWQRHIGLVMQDAPLFFGSVFDNIAFGDPNPDRDRAMQSAELANVAEVISSLPEGLESQVGHRGTRLSGGQRQRIALARAIYRDPWILILDEATSALDSDSERAIQQALLKVKGSLSILMVAHRLKTVELADRIIVLSGGEVAEEGGWDELLAHERGLFKTMVAAQEIGTTVVGMGD